LFVVLNQEAHLLIDQHDIAPQVAVPALVAPAAMPRRPGIQAPAATLTALLRAIERTEDLLNEETRALENRRAIDLVSFVRRKSQSLLEITRAARALKDFEVEPTVTDRLAGLKEKLERNQAVLRLHLEAVREVAELLAKAARDVDSDGTYSMPSYRQENG
jgi:hypothetical protein